MLVATTQHFLSLSVPEPAGVPKPCAEQSGLSGLLPGWLPLLDTGVAVTLVSLRFAVRRPGSSAISAITNNGSPMAPHPGLFALFADIVRPHVVPHGCQRRTGLTAHVPGSGLHFPRVYLGQSVEGHSDLPQSVHRQKAPHQPEDLDRVVHAIRRCTACKLFVQSFNGSTPRCKVGVC